MAYLLMIGLSLLIFPAMWLRIGTDPTLMLYVDLPLFLGATVSVLVYYTVSQFLRDSEGEGWARRLPALMGLGIGLAVNNARAVLSGFRKEVGTFERTPKYSIEEASDGWRGKRYRVPSDPSFLIEGALAVFFIGCFVAAISLEMWPSLPFLYLFLTGYCYMFLLAMTSNRVSRKAQPRLPEPGLTESSNGRSSSAA